MNIISRMVRASMMGLLVAWSAAVCIGIPDTATAIPVFSSISDLGTLGGSSSYGFDINDKGQVTGYADTSTSVHAFRSEIDGSLTDLGTGLYADTGEEGSVGYGINERGQVAALSFSATGTGYATRFDTDGSSTLYFFGDGRHRGAFDINNSGQVAGWGEVGGGDHAFRAEVDGTVTDLGVLGSASGPIGGSKGYGINNSGQVTGFSTTATDGIHAFRSEVDGSLTDLGTLRGGSSYGEDINDRGQVTGYSDGHAFRSEFDGSLLDLGTLGGYSHGYGINNASLVVGISAMMGGDQHGFLFDGTSMWDLNSLVDAALGWEISGAYGINNRGQITGYGSHNGSDPHAYLLTLNGLPAIPEPSTMLLTGTGLVGLVLRFWKKKAV